MLKRMRVVIATRQRSKCVRGRNVETPSLCHEALAFAKDVANPGTPETMREPSWLWRP